MTTHSYSRSALNNTDVMFRENIQAYSELLTAIGLIQTSDNGQINKEAATRPAAAGQSAGYEIFEFSDSLQEVSPIFLRVEYLSAGNIQIFGTAVTIGQGTDGAGNLTGVTSQRLYSYGASPTNNSFTTFGCHTEGFAGVMSQVGSITSSSSAASGSFMICRSCDANGHPTADGCIVYNHNVSGFPHGQALRFSGAAGRVNASPSVDIALLPLGVSQTISGEIPVYPMWMPLPALTAVVGAIAMPQALLGNVDTLEVAAVGVQPRTYLIALGGFQPRSNPLGFGMLWE